MRFDLHIHSKYSKDSILEPKTIIKIARKKGLNGIAITDHNTVKGGINTKKINDNVDFTVIVGSEIKTEYGDIIGLFLNEEIRSNDFFTVLDDIKSQGGYVILAHPYRRDEFPLKYINKIDAIEAFNSRSKYSVNVKALDLANRVKKPLTSGSDAHTFFEIGRGITNVSSLGKQSFLRDTYIEGKITNNVISHVCSFMTEKIKGAII